MPLGTSLTINLFNDPGAARPAGITKKRKGQCHAYNGGTLSVKVVRTRPVLHEFLKKWWIRI